MRCQRCGAELLDTDTFCVKCGKRVDEIPKCSECGEELREGTRFCHKCGTPVAEYAPSWQEPEEDEIPVKGTKTIDIPFDKIEKSIIMEAEQAVEKRELDDAQTEEPTWETERKEFDFSILTRILGIAILICVMILGIVLAGRKLSGILQEEEEIMQEQEIQITGKIQVIRNVNIRNYPDTENSSILGVARTGEVYEHYGLVHENWYHIRIDDTRDGYVYREYVEEIQ